LRSVETVKSHAPTTAGPLNLSGAAETDANFAGLDDDGYLAAPVGELHHPGKSLVVLEHVQILKRNLAASVGLPGRGGVGSKIFAKNNDFLVHGNSISHIENKRAGAKLQVNQPLCYFR
jgi:hypothetical protein